MLQHSRNHPQEKLSLHPRNRHRGRYDFKLLIESSPELAQWVKVNQYGDESIDFFNPEAVKMLNRALLKLYYDVACWDIPSGYLCPPVPGRSDYIHYAADLLGSLNRDKIPVGPKIRCLDIGIGSNAIYPIIGSKEYGWLFVGSDIDAHSLESAQKIVDLNPSLTGKLQLRLQHNPNDIFNGIIHSDEFFDLTICNPPFHPDESAVQSGTLRKLHNLKSGKVKNAVRNFGGQKNELWCDGGEARFVSNMIRQSRPFSDSALWFSTLVSKASNLKTINQELRNSGAIEMITIPMSQGNKISRIVAWTFLTKAQQRNWITLRWD